jgi:hypothetical protein
MLNRWLVAAMLLAMPGLAQAAEVVETCPARAGPHHLRSLNATFVDGGNQDLADDRIEVTLGLCGKAGPRSAYLVGFDAVAPWFVDTDRNGDGRGDASDQCADTRDGGAALVRGSADGLGTVTLVSGDGKAGDQVRFTVPVDQIAPGLARDGETRVAVWAEARLSAASLPAALPFTPLPMVADYLPRPAAGDACARPEVMDEVLSVVLAPPPQLTTAADLHQ